MFNFTSPRPSRRPSLTPMIDVVFLLLVFFMLAAHFGQDVALPLATSGGGTAYEGPPRLVTVTGATVALNGVVAPPGQLAAQLSTMVKSTDDSIFIQPLGDTTLQQMIDVIDGLRAAGFTAVVVVPRP